MSANFTESQEGFCVELLNLFRRWQAEGDMTAPEALDAVQFALNQWLDDDILIFEPEDIDLDNEQPTG